MRLARVVGHSLLATALASTALVALGGSAVAADPAGQALSRLRGDADGAVTIRSDGSGDVDFVGAPAETDVDNPAVKASTSVAAAADAHLARYGAALGAAQPGTTLTRTEVRATATGDVVRYQQRVDSVPVLGGQVVVSLGADRELSSILADTSNATRVGAATVGEAAAEATARAAFLKSSGGGEAPTVTPDGRWFLDAGVIGGDDAVADRTVWRFEVTRAANERREVLVDDRTGAVLMNVDLIAHADRVVCDNNNALQNPNVANTPCLTGYEGGPPSAVTDVNTAYDLSGVVADFYQGVAGIDLTALLGVDVGGGVKKLASTVKWCYSGYTCPYANAFWNGSQMYYGQGYAGADDVVGHEITHGFTERNSGLFYWSQSGAINESISDIIGEIIDHRHPSAGDSATNWALGEDVPGYAPDGLRNLQDPTVFGDPDATSSALYKLPETGSYPDSDGVHQNSGVGNKTFYLISQGGTFNGQTITGIDTGDATLTKSAKLWLLVDQSLSSGSDYADLGAVLDQSCQALVATSGSGFTAADCAQVHAATLATQLAQTPTSNPQPADAEATCPTGTVKRVLLDSETGDPATKFVPGPTWSRDGVPGWGQVAHTNPAAWASSSPSTNGSSSLSAVADISVPAGQQTYLWFQHWRLLEYVGSNFYDGGAVEVDRPGGRDGTAALPWVNGPTQTVPAGDGSPIAGQKAFGGDSRGYVASRVDLSSYAGQAIKPVFTLHTDSSGTGIGWFVDDIVVYTCDDEQIANTGLPTVSGTAQVGSTLTVAPGTWTPAVSPSFSFQWLRGGADIPGASASTYVPVPGDVGSNLSVRVTASEPGYLGTSASSAATQPVLAGALTTGVPTVSGTALLGRTLTSSPGAWGPAGVVLSQQWLRNGAPIPGATSTSYQLGLADVGSAISVQVTGQLAGYQGASATSVATASVVGVVKAGRPTLSGKAMVGRKLTAKTGSWTPGSVTFTYTWLRNGRAIKGAKRKTYTPTKADQGKRISVKVTGTKAGYQAASATSKATVKVKPKPKKRR